MNMKSKCDKGHFYAYHTILHMAECLFEDSEYLEHNIDGCKRGGWSNYYMPLLLVYIAAIESFSNSIGFVLIEDFESKYEKKPIKDKLKLIFKKIEAECNFSKEPFRTLTTAIIIRNEWVHCKASKQGYVTEWESSSFDDVHNIRSNLEYKTNKEFIVKLKNSVNKTIELASSKACKMFPENEDLLECLCNVLPVVSTELGSSYIK